MAERAREQRAQGWESLSSRAEQHERDERNRDIDRAMLERRERFSNLVEAAESLASRFNDLFLRKQKLESRFAHLRTAGTDEYDRLVENIEEAAENTELEMDRLTRDIEDARYQLESAVAHAYGSLKEFGFHPLSDVYASAMALRSLCQMKGIALRPPKRA